MRLNSSTIPSRRRAEYDAAEKAGLTARLPDYSGAEIQLNEL
jgi:hypothetical protein